MIDGYDNTYDLTDKEVFDLVPMMLSGLEAKDRSGRLIRDASNPATGKTIATGLSKYGGVKVAGVRVRKMISYLRDQFRIEDRNIVATQK